MKKALSLALAGTLALSLLSGCAADPVPSASAAPSAAPTPAPTQEAAAPYTYADTIAWDGQYDVVVVGFGGAGAASARYAADAGANVLLIDKAPEGHEGGNTRYCGQVVVNSSDYDKAMAYYKSLFGPFQIDEKVLEAYVKGVAGSKQLLIDDYGLTEETLVDWKGQFLIGDFCPEYPELEGSDSITLYTVSEGNSNGALWNLLREKVLERDDQIDVWYESPGKHLIQDPVSGTVIGVQIEKQGELVNIRATNGVVLATGGFENNPTMVQDYLGLTTYVPAGTLYNTGDGVKMATEVGADLWHMETYEGNTFVYGGVSLPVDAGTRSSSIWNRQAYSYGSLVLVGTDGVRYLNEGLNNRHGHIEENGEWVNPHWPSKTYLIFDQAEYDALTTAGPMGTALPEEFAAKAVKADTIAALAGQLGMSRLEQTVTDYNGFAKAGYDPQYGRSAESMTALSASGPYYALELLPIVLNTQGGPRRNENAEVLSTTGEPIPNLYSAGELGGTIAFQYNGGGNMMECMTFGKIAGTNAASPKGELPVMPGKTESSLVYTIDGDYVRNPGDDEQITLGDHQYLGVSSSGMGGDVKVVVTMDGDKIANVEVVSHKETEGIGTKAIDALPGAIVEANSTEVDAVASATITSKAIIEAVNDALTQVK